MAEDAVGAVCGQRNHPGPEYFPSGGVPRRQRWTAVEGGVADIRLRRVADGIDHDYMVCWLPNTDSTGEELEQR